MDSFARVGMEGYIVEKAVGSSKVKLGGVRLVGSELANNSKNRKV